jgi:hypothetical protein
MLFTVVRIRRKFHLAHFCHAFCLILKVTPSGFLYTVDFVCFLFFEIFINIQSLFFEYLIVVPLQEAHLFIK